MGWFEKLAAWAGEETKPETISDYKTTFEKFTQKIQTQWMKYLLGDAIELAELLQSSRSSQTKDRIGAVLSSFAALRKKVREETDNEKRNLALEIIVESDKLHKKYTDMTITLLETEITMKIFKKMLNLARKF